MKLKTPEGIPVLKTWPEKRRRTFFGPIAFGAFFLLFLILGFATQDVFFPLLIGIPFGLAVAWVLVGIPQVHRKDGKPLVDPKVRPYLFFPGVLVLTFLLYPVLGVLLTKVGMEPRFLAITSLVLALAASSAISYLVFGFPRAIRAARDAYARMPPERRPFLFFPVFAVIFLVLYVGLGVGTTALMSNFVEQTVTLLSLQVLLLLPVTLVVSALLAYLLVGFPKPRRGLRDSLPKVTGRHRPKAFLATFLLAGIPLSVAIGYGLSYAAAQQASSAFLPGELVLPLAFVLGYSLSLGVAALAWGTPARWVKQYDDYAPGMSPRTRLGAAGGAGLAVLLAVTVAAGIAGLDIFWGLLLGGVLGIGVGLTVAGAHKRIAARRNAPTLVPDLPERAKSLVMFTTWLVVSLVLFSILTYTLPDLVAVNAILSALLGLALGLFLVEQGLFRDMIARRREESQKRKAWARRRKEALKGAREESGPKEG